MDQSHPRSRRIAKRSEILACQENGKKYHAPHFLIFCKENKSNSSRFAVTVTTKIDKRAAVRNRVRRRLKEIFRANFSRLSYPMDIVVLVRRGGEQLSLLEIESEIISLLESRKVMLPRSEN